MSSAEAPDVTVESMLLPPDSEHLESDASRNKKYYFDDNVLIFRVGSQLFKVHRHFLRKESEVFNWMFACPPGADSPDGGSDERAIPLHGVTPAEFEALLDFFYEEKFQHHNISMLEWINLLAISTRFDFQRLRECAITAIEHGLCNNKGPVQDVNPIEQLLLAEKHDIPHWRRIAYVKICERSDPIQEWEAEKIGARETALLARARETIRNPHHRVPSPLPFHPMPLGLSHTPIAMHFSLPGSPGPPSNGFYHNRHRVDAIVSEVFFPSENHD
ncbi:hypothetical protein B0H14DRAFT_547305 [Mycena olivaceomarginata]|nr:hypothetical protein B0H14DRAFT_547305 [Mycena olivaceomarginata]